MNEDKNDSFFKTDHLCDDLKTRTVRGGAVTITAQGIKLVLGTGSTMILARLLSPEDYGLVAMVTAVTGFVALFKDMGLSMATIQRAEINHGQVSTLFWVNVGVSCLLMVITCALAPGIAWFYGEPRLTWITLVIASGYIFGGLTVQHQALLRRQMRFTTLSMVEICSLVASILTGIICALNGLGYWSLVWMQVTNATAMALGVWLTCGWMPGRPVRGSGVHPMLAFGGNLTGFTIVNYFGRNLDNILIGWWWGPQQLGLYSKAYNLLLLPLQQINAPISAVAVPALSRLQDNPKRYKKYYYAAIQTIAILALPLVVFTIIMSDDLILFFLGEQWVPAARIFMILGIATLLQPIYVTTGWLFTTVGRSDRMFRYQLVLTPVAVALFGLGLPFRAEGVAVAYACFNVLNAISVFWYASRHTPISITEILRSLFSPFLLCSLTALPILVSRALIPAGSLPSLRICVAGSLSLAVWLCLLYFVNDNSPRYSVVTPRSLYRSLCSKS